MSLYYAIHVEGFVNPYDTTDTSPVLFVHGDVTALTLPLSLSGYTVLPRLENNDPGENWSVDLRRPLGSGGAQSFRIFDSEIDSVLGRACLFDPTLVTWDIIDPIVGEGDTTILVSGGTVGIAPVLGLYWIEEECIEVTSVATRPMGSGTSTLQYLLTISRGLCGSRDRTHFITPTSIAPAEEGRDEFMKLWQRPNFGAFRFRGKQYLLNVPFAASTAVIVDARPFFIAEEPLAGIPSFEFKMKDVSELIESHTFQLTEGASSSYRMLVISEGSEVVSSDASGDRKPIQVKKIPSQCKLRMDRLRAWQFFGEPLSEGGQPGMSPSLVAGLNTRLTSEPKFSSYLKYTVLETEWLFKISSVAISSDGLGIELCLSLRDHTEGVGLDDEPEADDGSGALGSLVDRLELLGDYPNPGFTKRSTLTKVPFFMKAPKIDLWYGLQCTPVEAYLFLTTSYGGFSSDPYDVIIGRGIGIPSDWQNRGAAPINPLTVQWGTQFLLELNSLLSEEYSYFIKNGVKLGDFLANLFTIHTLLHGPLSNGTLTLRRWARPLDAGPIQELDLDITRPLGLGERLTPMRAFLLYSGIKLLTIEPEYVRSVTLGGPAIFDTGKPLSLRLWQYGNQLTDEKLQQGTLYHLLRAFFSTMGGAPIRYSPATHVMRQSFEIGDFVYLSSDRIPTPQGRGFSSVRFIVVGADLNYSTGIKTYRVLRDYYNELPRSTGLIAPSLTPPKGAAFEPGGLVAEIPVSSLGDAAFDALLDHLGTWDSIRTDGGFIHILSPDFHNPAGPTETEGWGEIYGEILDIHVDTGTGESVLIVEFDPAWIRGDISPEQILTTNGIISFADRRPEQANPQIALIEPVAAQLYNVGNDFLAISSIESFQRTFSSIGT